jgi:hypothetical protein
MVAKLLFLSKMGRLDIHKAIDFLSKRVKEPDMDNMTRLTSIFKYLHASIDIVLRLSAQAP